MTVRNLALQGFSGTITDPDASGTIASVVLDGDEQITARFPDGAATATFPGPSGSFSKRAESHTNQAGDARIFDVSRWSDGDNRATRIFDFYAAQRTAGQLIQGAFLARLYTLQEGGDYHFGAFGDPTPAGSFPTGTLTYNGEMIGSFSSVRFSGPASVTINFDPASRVVSGRINVTHWQASAANPRNPALIEFSGPLQPDGTVGSTQITLNGVSVSAADGALSARLFSANGQHLGGTFRVFGGAAGFSGAFLVQR